MLAISLINNMLRNTGHAMKITAWLKSDGDHVTFDEPVVELENDKASFEMCSDYEGTLHIIKQVGEVAETGELIGEIIFI